MESSVPNIMYVSAFLSGLEIIHLILDHLRFMDNADTGGYLVMRYLGKSVLNTLLLFLNIFFSFVNCTAGLYIKTYFGHGQCFI